MLKCEIFKSKVHYINNWQCWWFWKSLLWTGLWWTACLKPSTQMSLKAIV